MAPFKFRKNKKKDAEDTSIQHSGNTSVSSQSTSNSVPSSNSGYQYTPAYTSNQQKLAHSTSQNQLNEQMNNQKSPQQNIPPLSPQQHQYQQQPRQFGKGVQQGPPQPQPTPVNHGPIAPNNFNSPNLPSQNVTPNPNNGNINNFKPITPNLNNSSPQSLHYTPYNSQQYPITPQQQQLRYRQQNLNTPWKKYKLYNSPFPRYRHAASSISSEKNEIFIMGGLKDGSVFGDTWVISPTESPNGEYLYQCRSIDIMNNNPPERVGHSSVLCGNAYIIFGGDTVDTDDNGYPDDNFYLFNTNNSRYTLPDHILNKPKGRYGHTIGVIAFTTNSSRLYLFGGQLENKIFNDLHYFELTSFKNPSASWEQVLPIDGLKPPPITNHSMIVYKNKLYIFGGVYNNQNASNDLWCFDPAINKWSKIQTHGTLPPPTNEHSASIVMDQMYVYGGNDFTGNLFDSLYILNMKTYTWSKLPATLPGNPGQRCGHSMTFITSSKKILIMGGDKKDYVYDDVNNFETYETLADENMNVGTMIYELDLSKVDYFISNNSLVGNGSFKSSDSQIPSQLNKALPENPPVGNTSYNTSLERVESPLQAIINTNPNLNSSSTIVPKSGSKLEQFSPNKNENSIISNKLLDDLEDDPSIAGASTPVKEEIPKLIKFFGHGSEYTDTNGSEDFKTPSSSPIQNEASIMQSRSSSFKGLDNGTDTLVTNPEFIEFSDDESKTHVQNSNDEFSINEEYQNGNGFNRDHANRIRYINESEGDVPQRTRGFNEVEDDIPRRTRGNTVNEREELLEPAHTIQNRKGYSSRELKHNQMIDPQEDDEENQEVPYDEARPASSLSINRYVESQSQGAHASFLDNYTYRDSQATDFDTLIDKPSSPNDTPPQSADSSGSRSSPLPISTAGSSTDNSQIKQMVISITNELNTLRLSAREQMLIASEKISKLEEDKSVLEKRHQEDTTKFTKELKEKQVLLEDLQKKSIEEKEVPTRQPNSGDSSVSSIMFVKDEDLITHPKFLGVLKDLNSHKRTNLEMMSKVSLFENENKQLSSKLDNFEPFMNNQMIELEELNNIIKSQNEKIESLHKSIKSTEDLEKEINLWKHQHNDLLVELNNLKTINGYESDADGNENSDTTSRSIGFQSTANISNNLDKLIELWDSNKKNQSSRDLVDSSNSNNSELITKLQAQINDLLTINKEQEQTHIKSIDELTNLKTHIETLTQENIKLGALKQYEDNYRDALQSVRNTSKALDLTQVELSKQREINKKMQREIDELKLYRASRRASSRTHTPLINNIPENQNSDDEQNGNNSDDDEDIKSAHYNMKIRDLQADLIIIKQERDQLKESVVSLKKKLLRSASEDDY